MYAAWGLHTAELLNPGKARGVPGSEGPLLEDHDEHEEEGRERETSGRGTTKRDELESRLTAATVDGGGKGRAASLRPRAGECFAADKLGCLRNAALMSKRRETIRDIGPSSLWLSESYPSSRPVAWRKESTKGA